MENLIDDMITDIMKLSDIKSLYQFSQCSKKMWLLMSSDQNLWKQKLSLDYKIVPYQGLNAHESYKWYKKVPSIVNRVLKIFDALSFQKDSPFNIPFGLYLIKPMRISGPNVDMINHEVSSCGLKSFLLRHYSRNENFDLNKTNEIVEKFYEYLFDAINIIFSENAEKFLMAANHISVLNAKPKPNPSYEIVYHMTKQCNKDDVIIEQLYSRCDFVMQWRRNGVICQLVSSPYLVEQNLLLNTITGELLSIKY
jgi:hypothetical protein